MLANMNWQYPQPTRTTLLFYAAFAVCLSNRVSGEVYWWPVGKWLQIGIGINLLIVLEFLVLTMWALITALKARSLPWAHGFAALGSLVAAHVIWRYVIDDLPNNGFKDVGIFVNLFAPAVFALGIAAILSERKLRLRYTRAHHPHQRDIQSGLQDG